MDKDWVKGAVNDAAGRAKRQVGEWTGNTNAQVEGTVQQAKGKIQKAWGNVKDAARDADANRRACGHDSGSERENKPQSEHAHSGRRE
jgi:uncharacterized protein YjbJ (UPF0337 family)